MLESKNARRQNSGHSLGITLQPLNIVQISYMDIISIIYLTVKNHNFFFLIQHEATTIARGLRNKTACIWTFGCICNAILHKSPDSQTYINRF